ncbi:MAG: hypothetical protein AAFN93_26765 [Bacteroidota bacterium]
MAGLNQEIWTEVVVRQFRTFEEAVYLDTIPDYSTYVTQSKKGKNESIHMSDIGADPEVLINNTTYPIGTMQQVDGDIVIKLDKLETKNVSVSDDEIQYISYDKIGEVTKNHVSALDNTKHQKAIHSMAPATNTANTPIIQATGPDDGTGRKRLIKKDIVTLKDKFDAAKIPLKDRHLVLSSTHYNDLLHEDQKFADHLYDAKTGKVMPYMNFMIWQNLENPYFHKTNLTKLAFGAVPTPDHTIASVCFYAPDMFKAKGSTKVYQRKAEDDPENRENTAGMRTYYIVAPRKQRGMGAII